MHDDPNPTLDDYAMMRHAVTALLRADQSMTYEGMADAVVDRIIRPSLDLLREQQRLDQADQGAGETANPPCECDPDRPRPAPGDLCMCGDPHSEHACPDACMAFREGGCRCQGFTPSQDQGAIRPGAKATCKHCGKPIVFEPYFFDGKLPNPPIWVHPQAGTTCSTRPDGWDPDGWPHAEPGLPPVDEPKSSQVRETPP